jgi:polysaccharide biosynthesis protein PslA
MIGPIELAPSLERRRLKLYLVQLLGDAAMLLLGFALAGWLYLGNPMATPVWNAAEIILPLFLTVALLNRSYSVEALVKLDFALQRVIAALTVALALLVLLLFLARSSLFFSRFGVGLAIGFSFMLIVWWRANFQPIVQRWVGQRGINLLVIDDGGARLRLPNSYTVIAADAGLRPSLTDPHTLDRLSQVISNMDRVIITCPPERRTLWSLVLKGGQMQGEIVDTAVEELGILGTSRSEGVGTLVVAVGPLGLRARVTKRAVDLLITLLALAALALPMLVCALLIRLEDGGPALFRQRRVGRSNQFFTILKFRTMSHTQSDIDGRQSASRDDRRVTQIGRFLRLTSIDELPQLFNVLSGEMSLVGPRPHALASQAGDKLFWEVDSRYWQRHALKPGMSGLAQVRGLRGSTDEEGDLVARLQADLEYVNGWTVIRDFRILISTLQVLTHDRAF